MNASHRTNTIPAPTGKIAPAHFAALRRSTLAVALAAAGLTTPMGAYAFNIYLEDITMVTLSDTWYTARSSVGTDASTSCGSVEEADGYVNSQFLGGVNGGAFTNGGAPTGSTQLAYWRDGGSGTLTADYGGIQGASTPRTYWMRLFPNTVSSYGPPYTGMCDSASVPVLATTLTVAASANFGKIVGDHFSLSASAGGTARWLVVEKGSGWVWATDSTANFVFPYPKALSDAVQAGATAMNATGCNFDGMGLSCMGTHWNGTAGVPYTLAIVASGSATMTAGANSISFDSSTLDQTKTYVLYVMVDDSAATSNYGRTYYQELAYAAVGPTGPTLASSVPADNATDVSPGSTIVLTFSEATVTGTDHSSLKIVNDTDNTTETIDVTSPGGKFAWSNNFQTLTITPGTALAASKNYHLEIDATAFNQNGSNIAYAGISNATTLNFSMVSGPAFSSLTPAANAYIKAASSVGYTLSKTAASGSLVFTHSGGSADSASPQTCTLQGTALQTGGARTVGLGTDANGCASAVTLVDGAVYTIALSATDSIPLSGTASIAGITYDTTAPDKDGSTPISGAKGSSNTVNTTVYEAQDSLTLTFSEPVLVSSITGNAPAVSGGHSLGSPLASAVSPSNGYASAFTFTLGSMALSLAVGDTLTFSAANVIDRAGNPAAADVVFTVPGFNAAPTATVDAISGTAKIGQTLTGGYTYNDAESNAEDSGASGSSYRWVRSTDSSASTAGDNADAATGATGGANKTYTPATADYGKYLFYCVTPKATSGTTTGAESCSAAAGPVSRDAGSGDPVPNAFGNDTGDGNGDGTPDWQQTFVASLPTTGAGSIPTAKRWATFEVSPNTLNLTNVTNSAAPTGLTRGKTMPLGKFGFTVSGLAVGGTATLSLFVDNTLGIRDYLKQANGQGEWNNIATGTTVFGNKTRITFQIVDGGPYDADGVANGTIVDPGGAVLDLLNPVVPENTTDVGDMSAALALNSSFSTLQGAVTYTITGADAAKFAIDATSGRLRFIAAPDFEAPGSAANSNVYSITVTAGGATVGSAGESITVTVLDDTGTQGVIANLAGDRATFTPGTAEYIDYDPTLSTIGVFSDPISGYLLISQRSGSADGTFTLDSATGLHPAMVVDSTLNGANGAPLKYTLTNATARNLEITINALIYDAPTAGERAFSVILNNGANSSEAVGFTMIATGDGACGTANGGSVSSAPSANLCVGGTATPVTGSGPWNWACVGSGTGANASCSASVAAAAPAPAPSGGNDYTPPAPSNPTLPSGGGTVAPSGGQTVTVTDNGKEGSTIDLPGNGTGTSGGNDVKVTLPGSGTITASSTSAGTKLGVTQVTLPGSTTSVSAVTVDQGSASFTASKTGQAMAGLKNGIVVISGTSNSQVTVDATGSNAKIGVKSSDTLIVPTGVQNVSGTSVDLPAPTTGGAGKSVNVSVGGKEISIQASQPNTSMTFKVVDIGGVQTPVVEVTGAAQVSSSGDNQPIVSVGGNVIKTGKSGGSSRVCNTIVQASSDSRSDAVHVVTCYIVLDAGSFSGLGGGGTGTSNHFAAIKDGIVWAGETAEFDKSGKVTSAYVGTRQGDTDAVGDDLVPGGNKLAAGGYQVGAFIPRLTGTPLRLSGAKLDERIFETVNNALGVTTQPATPTQSDQGVLNFNFSGSINNQGVTGSGANVTYTITSDTASILPSRRVRVDTSRADGVSIGAEGDVEVATGGLVTTFAPSLADPKAFADRVSQILPGAATTLRWNGSLQVDAADGTTYVGRPQWSYWSAAPGAETFSSTADGNVLYSDNGHAQPLFPDFYDYDALQGTFRNALNDPTLTVLPRMDGTAVATVNGQSYVLAPQWRVTQAAADKPAWWVEGDVVYIKNADGTAQGFTVK